MKLKKISPTSTYRTNSKGVNFGALFGAGAASLARRLREQYNFSEKDVDNVIELMKLDDLVAELVQKNKSKVGATPKFKDDVVYRDMKDLKLGMKYLAVATKFRDVFFKTYPGLMARLDREKAEVKRTGFMQSWKGPKRRLPELRYMTYDGRGNLKGADKKLWSKMYGNLGNIAGNSDAQVMEVYHAMTLWHNIQTNCKKWGLRSRVWNGTHDSIDKFLEKDEVDLVLALEKFVASAHTVPYGGLELDIEADVSDVSSFETREKQYYKHGNGFNPAPLVDALRKWNDEHPDKPLKWYNTLPTDYDVSSFPEDLMIVERTDYVVQ
jgi:hypothetical protein